MLAAWTTPAEKAAAAALAPLSNWASVCWALEVRLAEADRWEPIAARHVGVIEANVEGLSRFGRGRIQIGLVLHGAILVTLESELTGPVAEMVRLPLLVCDRMDDASLI